VINDTNLTTQQHEDLETARTSLNRMIDIIERLRKVDDRVVTYVGETRMIDLPTD
jgi:hypothetical protein